MTYTRTIYEACASIKEVFTPQDIYEHLLSRGVSIKKGTVKRLIIRLYHRGILARLTGQRGIYFFAQEGDNCNQERGQKGTEEGGCNHSLQNKESTKFLFTRGQKNDCKACNHSRKRIPVLRRVCAAFANNPEKVYTIREIHRLFNDKEVSKLYGEVKYRTVQSAFNYLLREGIIYRVPGMRGYYKLTNKEVALAWLERGTIPYPPSKGTTPHFKLPSLNLHGQVVDKTIVIPETVWGRLKSMQSSVSPFFNKKPPQEKDAGKQWVFETENCKLVVSEKTLKTRIYPKGEDWLKDLSELLGRWVVQELKGAKVTMHGAINKREYEGFRAGVLEVVQDHSEFGKDGDYEFHGPEEAVKTAMGLTLTGHFTPEQSATIADLMYTYAEKHKNELEALKREITVFERFTIEELDHLRRELQKQGKDFSDQIELLKKEIKEHLNTIAGGIRVLLNPFKEKTPLEGYA